MRTLIALTLFAGYAFAQQAVRWSATTGDLSLSGSAATVTVQQPAASSGGSQIELEQIVVYCSVACSVTQAANGTAATATAGTVTPILPTPLNTTVPVKFFTGSDVGAGTAQGGIFHIPAATTGTICLNTSCGASASVILGAGNAAKTNYSVTIATISGTANITFYGKAY